MIMIYSADRSGKLFTDPLRRFYVDGSLLQEKAVAVKTAALLDKIALRLDFPSFDALRTFTRCKGVTENTLMTWIYSGEVADAVRSLC